MKRFIFLAILLLASCQNQSNSVADTTQSSTSTTKVSVPTSTTIDPLVQAFVTTTTAPAVQESDGRVFVAGGNYSGLRPRFEGNQFIFSSFDLQGATFSGAVLDAAHLDFGNFTRSNFSGAKLTCLNSQYIGTYCAKLDSGIFVEANFSAAKLNGVSARFADFTSATLSKADFGPFEVRDEAASLENLERNFNPCVDLAGANFTSAKLIGANLECANFSVAIMVNADLSNANLTGADLSRADLTGANLRGATLASANVNGTKFTGAIMPDGTKHP